MPDGAFDPTEQLARARAFAEKGWRPFPVEYGGKRPHVNVGKWGTATASAAPDKMLERWFSGAQVNIGIAAKGSGLVIIDEDAQGAFLRLAADHGHEVPLTYTVITAKGRHYYFTAPEGYPIGNAPGVLKSYGIDVRGGGDGDGGYVVAAGSLHESGAVYTVAEDVDAVDMPMWLVELLIPRLEEEPPVPAELVDDETSLFGDRDARRFTRAQAREYMTAYATEPLQTAQPGGRNTVLNNAATVVGHFVPAFVAHEVAVKRLLSLAAGVGLGGHEAGATARSGLARGMEEPYVLVEEESPDAFDADVARELQRLRVREEALRQLRADKRAERPSILSGVLDDLDAIEEPAMLLDALIPERSVGFLAGRSGAYKSFLAVAWAYALATGQPWCDFKVTRPVKVLYVAAEGPAGAAERMKAWEARTGVSRSGKLLLYPKPVHLNDEDQATELGEVLKAGEFGYLVVDTYHRSAPGTEENDATEFGVVFDAVARFRDELGVGVLFVDHTGHSVDGRPRGSSAKGDDADFVLTASYAGDTRGPEVQRTLKVIKLKDQESEGEWPIHLANAVDDDGRLVPSFPVAIIREKGPDDIFAPPHWWEHETPPDELVSALKDGSRRGAGVEAALMAWRLMTAIGEDATLTAVQIGSMLGEAPGFAAKGSTVRTAMGLMVRVGWAAKSGEKYELIKP